MTVLTGALKLIQKGGTTVKKNKNPKFETVIVLAKFDNGEYHQVLLSKDDTGTILDTLYILQGTLRVNFKPVTELKDGNILTSVDTPNDRQRELGMMERNREVLLNARK